MTNPGPAETSAIDRVDAARDVRRDVDLGAFVTEHYDRLLGLARLVCRDGADAGDAVQAGLERAWRQRATLRDQERVRPWLDRIIVRESIRIGRSRRSWLGRVFGLDQEVEWVDPVDPFAVQGSSWSAVRAAFSGLTPEQRAVIALHLYLGYSVAETAELVGAPIETVRSRLRLAKDRLRRELQESES